MTFEEVKEIFKKSIDNTDTMNQAIENFIQLIYLKGYADANDEWLEKLINIRTEVELQREEVRQREKISKEHFEDEGLTNYYFGLNDGLKDARDIIDIYMVKREITYINNCGEYCCLIKKGVEE